MELFVCLPNVYYYIEMLVYLSELFVELSVGTEKADKWSCNKLTTTAETMEFAYMLRAVGRHLGDCQLL